MAPGPMRPLVDRILGGRLDDILLEWRSQGLSFEACARRFATEHDIEVTTETVRKWFSEAEARASDLKTASA